MLYKMEFLYKKIFIAAVTFFALQNGFAQNVGMNILSADGGTVKKGKQIYIEVSICNSSTTTTVEGYRLKPQLSVPLSALSVSDSGHILPPGWAVVFNRDGVIRLSNGTDRIGPNTCRTLMISLSATKTSSREIISGNLLFSNGIAPGLASGPATNGDLPADNSSTTACTIIQ